MPCHAVRMLKYSQQAATLRAMFKPPAAEMWMRMKSISLSAARNTHSSGIAKFIRCDAAWQTAGDGWAASLWLRSSEGTVPRLGNIDSKGTSGWNIEVRDPQFYVLGPQISPEVSMPWTGVDERLPGRVVARGACVPRSSTA